MKKDERTKRATSAAAAAAAAPGPRRAARRPPGDVQAAHALEAHLADGLGLQGRRPRQGQDLLREDVRLLDEAVLVPPETSQKEL